MKTVVKTTPKCVSAEYRKGADFKSGIGQHGIFEQTKRNERFFVGDQWYGAKCGNDRPLVRRNVIKRIAEYKMAVISAAPLSVNYSADGIPDTTEIREQSADVRQELINGNVPSGNMADEVEISAITAAMTDFFKATAERVKLEGLKEQALRNAYISGTGLLFCYWDSEVETGLFADGERKAPIKGDVACEVLDIENVNFGDPNCDDVQKQPYIIIAQRRDFADVKREAMRNQLSTDDIIPDRGDIDGLNSGDRGEEEPTDSRRVTVYTKLWKEWNKDASSYRVMAVRVTEKAFVRKPWCLNLRNYPIAKFSWERRRSSVYGESEITYLIPNQIAINRALSAAVWNLMLTGMPIMLVDGNLIDKPITNDPGQIIKVYGTASNVAGAAHYMQPPNSATQFQNVVNDLCNNTLSDSGANDAALGNMRADNATAIIHLQEAALQPMQVYKNRFYDFIEDIARIWADFWINCYGKRKIKVEDRNGVQYLTFDSYRYKDLLFSARVDVGAATLYSEAVVISTLDSLLSAELITFDQYLARIPKGIIPDITGLREDIKNANANLQSTAGGENEAILQMLAQQHPELYEEFQKMSPEEQQATLARVMGASEQIPPAEFETEEIGDI